METKLTRHLKVERADRVALILSHIDLGGEIKRRIAKGVAYCLTSTGIVMIRDKDDDTIITLYLPNLKQIQFVYDTYAVPKSVIATYKRNERLRKEQDKLD